MQLDMVLSVVNIGGGTSIRLGDTNVTGVGEQYVAILDMAGIRVTGKAATSPIEATRNLFWDMSNGAADSEVYRQTNVALALALDERSVDDLAPQLPPVDEKRTRKALRRGTND